MEERVTFNSDGLKLAGVLHVPDAKGAGGRRPGVLVLHGFGSNKDSGGTVATAIARRLGIGRASVYRALASRGGEPL